MPTELIDGNRLHGVHIRSLYKWYNIDIVKEEILDGAGHPDPPTSLPADRPGAQQVQVLKATCTLKTEYEKRRPASSLRSHSAHQNHPFAQQKVSKKTLRPLETLGFLVPSYERNNYREH